MSSTRKIIRGQMMLGEDRARVDSVIGIRDRDARGCNSASDAASVGLDGDSWSMFTFSSGSDDYGIGQWALAEYVPVWNHLADARPVVGCRG